jgi:uncharacterized membrane protein YqiK
MFMFIVGVLLLTASAVWFIIGKQLAKPRKKQVKERFRDEVEEVEYVPLSRVVSLATSIPVGILALVLITFSTAIYVNDNQGGVVIRKFGADLKAGKIIATQGEKGPQAYVLPPGWHFGYWPWLYELEPVDNLIVHEGQVGVVTTADGKALPEGQIYAPAWTNVNDMMDADKFLTTDGHKGPQLTVLPPGQYRYNPRLYSISTHPMLEVRVGFVAVIKANAGPTYEGEDVEMVNGVPIVPNGNRGIWEKALTPNAYYLHPNAYEVKTVQTTNRVFNYNKGVTGPGDTPFDTSIESRTKDGFKFPVDVRVSVNVSAEDAPYVVARLGDPDSQFGKTPYTVLEQKAVLPKIRAIFRNTAESKEALEFLTQRSSIEKDATSQFSEGLKDFKQVAVQEKEMYAEQQLAEQKRAEMEKAKAEAEQEKPKAEAAAKIDIADSEAQAAIKKAEGEAAAYTKKIEAIGGVENFVLLELARSGLEKWSGEVPGILVNGGGGADSALNAMFTKYMKLQLDAEAAKK